jgi:hypothetical protein
VAHMRNMGKAYTILIEKSEAKRPLGIASRARDLENKTNRGKQSKERWTGLILFRIGSNGDIL